MCMPLLYLGDFYNQGESPDEMPAAARVWCAES